MDFLTSFKSAQRVSTPLVTVRTFDAQSTVNSVKSIWAEDKDKMPPMVIWDCINGYRPVNDTGAKALTQLYSDTGASAEVTIDVTEALRISPALTDEIGRAHV